MMIFQRILLRNGDAEYYQRIIIWDFLSPHNLKKLANRIAKSMSVYSVDYLDRCRQRDSLQQPYIPIKWKYDSNFKSHSIEKYESENTEIEISLSLMKSYSLNSHVARSLFLSDEFSHLEFPHDVSAEEKLFIENDESSLIVCGRSGTGKTTVMLHRMYRLDVASRSVEDDTPLHQMMVTASPILAAAIKKNYQEMLLTNTNIKTDENRNNGEDENKNENRNDYTNENIMMNHVFKSHSASPSLSLSLSQISATTPSNERENPIYPLILTYKEFIQMVDKYLSKQFFINDDMREIDLHRFETFYYPQLGDVTGIDNKKIDTASLFTEIMSCIKGSFASLKNCDVAKMSDDGDMIGDAAKKMNERSVLDRQSYVHLSTLRRGSGLISTQREKYYDLYEKYQELKSFEKNDYDIADCVSFLYRSLSKEKFRGPQLEYIYVDEVQDLTESQISLFKFVCHNPNGYFFAGDTAQTIANGVGFQFNSLKDFFHSEFLIDHADKSILIPHVQQLKQNFRTHNGVLKLANTVIKLISHFFPLTIDKLADESSLVIGPKPIFLMDQTDVISALFSNSTKCEFGSEQVILTRDVATKEKLRTVCKNSALVLTVLEAKGMEFQDCLIYNFFSSGDYGSKWRILGGAYEFLGAPEEDGKPFTKFDSSIHSVLNLELKYLYVLLTRAKKNLVIFEENKQIREPILNLWKHKDINVVEYKLFNDDMRDIFSEKSDPEVWLKKGKEFFGRKNYESAKTCFYRGGDRKSEIRSTAYLLDSQALIKESSSKSKSIDEKKKNLLLEECYELYNNSAENFELIEENEMAANQYVLGQEHKKAAEIYLNLKLYHKAAECYKKLGLWKEAANNYSKCNMIENAIDCCLEGHLYERALEIYDKMDSDTYDINKEVEINETDQKRKGKEKERKKGNGEETETNYTTTKKQSTTKDISIGDIPNTIAEERKDTWEEVDGEEDDDDDIKNKKDDNVQSTTLNIPNNNDDNDDDNDDDNNLDKKEPSIVSMSAPLITSPISLPTSPDDATSSTLSSTLIVLSAPLITSLPISLSKSSAIVPMPQIVNMKSSREMIALREKIINKAGEHYSESHQISKMMLFVDKMNSKKEKKDFLSLHDHLDLLINIELKGMNMFLFYLKPPTYLLLHFSIKS